MEKDSTIIQNFQLHISRARNFRDSKMVKSVGIRELKKSEIGTKKSGIKIFIEFFKTNNFQPLH